MSATWKLETLTTKAGVDKLGLCCGTRRVCDCTVHDIEDDCRARFIVKACNNHSTLVDALAAAVQQAKEALALGATGPAYWEDLLETIEPALKSVQS